MPLFRYEALDRTGNKVVGAMQVPDERALAARLSAMGYQPTLVEAARHSAARSAPPAATAAAGPPASRLSASQRGVAQLFHQLYLSFKAGMAPFQALTTVAAQTQERSLRRALEQMALETQQGGTLSGAMARFPRVFSRGDVGMVRAAEYGGFLPEALGALAVQHEQDDNTRRRLRVWVWFWNSNVVTLFLVIPLAFCLKESIPALDIRPGLAAAGLAFTRLTLPLLLLYGGLLFALHRARREPGLRARWHRFLLRLPTVGKINYLRSSAVFLRTLQQLYHAGVPAETAWEISAGAVPNDYLVSRFDEGQPVVAATGRFSAGLQQVNLLEATDVAMIMTGESSGDVEQGLDYLASRYEEETRVALGAGVVRGATFFVTWAFLVGAVGLAVLAWGYAQGLLRLAAE